WTSRRTISAWRWSRRASRKSPPPSIRSCCSATTTIPSRAATATSCSPPCAAAAWRPWPGLACCSACSGDATCAPGVTTRAGRSYRVAHRERLAVDHAADRLDERRPPRCAVLVHGRVLRAHHARHLRLPDRLLGQVPAPAGQPRRPADRRLLEARNDLDADPGRIGDDPVLLGRDPLLRALDPARQCARRPR